MWWHVLGVERHADIESIKKAYSALIKEFRPEAHPEKFSEIRQAFEQARKQLARAKPALDYVEQPDATPEPVTHVEPSVKEPPVRVTVENFQPTIPVQAAVTNADEPEEEPVINLLERWKKSKFRDSQWIEQVLDHSTTHDFFA
ncbi:MAG: DnaJ domain-containing protein, partial [Gammaproteobacteria bacterium]|nr:DnaJ domain-containing protein [Gammaproteobacteria bacterium]